MKRGKPQRLPTPEDEAYIVETYSHKTAQEIASARGLSRNQVIHLVRLLRERGRLPARKEITRLKTPTNQDVDYIAANFPGKTAGVLAARLKLTVLQVLDVIRTLREKGVLKEEKTFSNERPIRPTTPDDIEYIRKNRKRKTPEELATSRGLTLAQVDTVLAAIKKKSVEVRRKPRAHTPRVVDPADAAFVAEHFKNMTSAEIAEQRGLAVPQVEALVRSLRREGVNLPLKKRTRSRR